MNATSKPAKIPSKSALGGVSSKQSEFEYDLWRSHHPRLSSQPQTWQIWLRLRDRHFPQIFLMIGSEIRHRDRVLNMLLG